MPLSKSSFSPILLLFFFTNKWASYLLNCQNKVDVVSKEAELIVQTIYMSSGRWLPKEPSCHHRYQRLFSVTNELCHQLSLKVHKKNSPDTLPN